MYGCTVSSIAKTFRKGILSYAQVLYGWRKQRFLILLKHMIDLSHGPLAHLVERTHGMGEVSGSSPLWSTNRTVMKIISFILWALVGIIVLPCVFIAGNIFPMWSDWGEEF